MWGRNGFLTERESSLWRFKWSLDNSFGISDGKIFFHQLLTEKNFMSWKLPWHFPFLSVHAENFLLVFSSESDFVERTWWLEKFPEKTKRPTLHKLQVYVPTLNSGNMMDARWSHKLLHFSYNEILLPQRAMEEKIIKKSSFIINEAWKKEKKEKWETFSRWAIPSGILW